jgi:hypothetical protein
VKLVRGVEVQRRGRLLGSRPIQGAVSDGEYGIVLLCTSFVRIVAR